MSRRLGARRAIGLGLLIPGFLLTHPTASAAESTSPKSQQKRAEPGSRAAQGQVGGDRGARDASPRCLHVVHSGDSISRIALRYGVTRHSLVAANHLADPDRLKLGQRLAVPGCRPDRAPGSADAKTAVPGREASVLKPVGPRRVLTRMHLAEPEFEGEAIEFRWPVDGPVVSGFGNRGSGWHAGVDIKAEPGTPIMAAAPGTVYFSGVERAYGRMIKIQHANGFTTIYAHNLQNLVEVGDEVEAGTIIATVGRTGQASANHLHFEIRRDGMAYNPQHVLGDRELPAAVVAGEMAPPLTGEAAARRDYDGHE